MQVGIVGYVGAVCPIIPNISVYLCHCKLYIHSIVSDKCYTNHKLLLHNIAVHVHVLLFHTKNSIIILCSQV